jgi:hypothetical protein
MSNSSSLSVNSSSPALSMPSMPTLGATGAPYLPATGAPSVPALGAPSTPALGASSAPAHDVLDGGGRFFIYSASSAVTHPYATVSVKSHIPLILSMTKNTS